MPEIALVDKEDALGVLGGSYFGSKVRIVARSPTYVIFNGSGGRMWKRDVAGKFSGSWHDEIRLFHDRPTIAKYEAARAKIDAAMGEGAGDAVVLAWRKNKTALIDGGGERLPLPNLQAAAITYAAYDAVKPDWRADLSAEVARCKQCGAELRPDTDHHRLGYDLLPDHPRSHEDCQKLTNRRVIAVHGYGAHHKSRYGFVEWFEVWDGDRYQDPDFCDDKCAARYGRRAAQDLPPLSQGIEPVRQEHRRREDTEHFVRKVMHISTDDGKTFAI